uniref:Uncharacterized protein n=1 Tax=Kalanchoe fedtschenkoi TaxID=63787 RepID=A0A7N0TJJ3_KALFE
MTVTTEAPKSLPILPPTHVIKPYSSIPVLFEKASDEEQADRIRELIQQVHGYLTASSTNSTSTMKLIDTIQRLGLSHHFETEIRNYLNALSQGDTVGDVEDLFTTTLRFRLLRQNGYATSSDVFDKFMDKTKSKFHESLCLDTIGMLSLYETSYLGVKGETNLIQAKELARIYLRQSLTGLNKEVSAALTLPRHLRMPRLEARNYIQEYSKKLDCNVSLLQLATLEFNKVQLQHQDELTEIKRWWKDLGLVNKLGFGRDRPLECFLWSVGIFQEPCQSTCRIELTKTIAILLVLDDVYDTYGQYDDLLLFTNAIKRWDLASLDELPEYMKICYMALYNTNNDIAYRILKQHGINVVSHLKRTWIDIIESFIVEAKWFKMGYVPTSEEHLATAVTSGGTYMALVHAFFLIGQGVTAETMEMMNKPYPNLFSNAGKILRLWDDLGTAKEEQEKGDVASSIQCYMKEAGMGEDEAREHVKQLIRSLWTDLNGELMAANKALPLPLINASFNLARTAQVIYQHGDDSKLPSVKEQVQALFFRPL